MAEYIEREAAIKSFCDGCIDEKDCHASPHKYVCAEVETIKAIPAADVRPVVLCKDCQDSYKWENAHGDSYRYCGYLRSRWNHDTDRMVDDDDYCKWGVKREES